MVFDAGPVISLAMNNLLWVLARLKQQFGGELYITDKVKEELIDRPLHTKRFKFEALQILKLVSEGTIGIRDTVGLSKSVSRLLGLANNSFKARKKYIRIVHDGEISSLSCALALRASCVVIDERTTRRLVEEPYSIAELLKERLHTEIAVNRNNLDELNSELSGLRVLRSTELITVAYELGLFDSYATCTAARIARAEEIKKELLDSLLWGLKLNGCAITKEELNRLLRLET